MHTFGITTKEIFKSFDKKDISIIKNPVCFSLSLSLFYINFKLINKTVRKFFDKLDNLVPISLTR